MFGYDTAHQHAHSHAQIPAREDSGIGGTTLVVLRQVDEHILKCRPHVTIAQPDDERCQIIAPFILQARKNGISEHRHHHTHTRVLHHLAPSERLSARESGEDKTNSEEGEEEARSSRDAKALLAINRNERAHYAIRKGKGEHRQEERPSLQQEEAVKRQARFGKERVGILGRGNHRTWLELQGCIHYQAQKRANQRERKEQVIRMKLRKQPQCHRGRDGRCYIIAQTIITDTFRSSRRRQYIYCNRRKTYTCGTKWRTMDCSENGQRHNSFDCNLTANNITSKANDNTTIISGAKNELTSGADTNIKSSANMSLEATSLLSVKAQLISISSAQTSLKAEMVKLAGLLEAMASGQTGADEHGQTSTTAPSSVGKFSAWGAGLNNLFNS